MDDKLSGRCLCGAVSYEAVGEPMIVGHCYCTDCRKSSGTGHCTHVAMSDGGYRLSGELTFYELPADSGNIVARGFCPRCGSAIHSTNSAMPGMVFIRASSLDNPDSVQPAMSVYASRAPAWDQADPALPMFKEMPEGGPEAAMEL